MKLIVITPTSSQEYDTSWIDIQTPAGGFVIQDKHAPTMFTLLPDKEITFRLATGKECSLLIPSGVIIIEPYQAKLIVDDFSS